MKSLQTHMCSQQKAPTVVATMHVKPFLHCLLAWSVVVSPSEQSSSDGQVAVQSGTVLVFMSAAGERQSLLGHSTACPLSVALVPLDDVTASGVSREQTRPMCL